MKKTGRQPQSQNRFRCKVVATAVAACFAADIAFANPTGPVVVNGQVSFARAGSVLSVTNSPSSIINWQQFSIAGGETTRFIQQSAASAVLNRVVGGDPSSILGTLQSNGRVFLINPSGIMFGAGSQIDVAGLVASTLRLSNEDFLTGRMNFVADPAHAAAVVNQGRISASPGGQVYLVGTAVDNQGVITAPNGDIVLAAGNSVRVTEGAGSQLQVEIRAPADSAVNLSEAVYGSRGIYGGLVRNSGTISANSVVQGADGRIILKASGDAVLTAGSRTTASGARGGTVTVEAGNAVTVSGAVEANGDSGAGGNIAFNAANELTLDSTSTVTANGTSGGAVTVQSETGTLIAQGVIEAKGGDGPGGAIRLLGERVALLPGMRVDASGEVGGGVVLVGGDYQGGNPEVKNASVTDVGDDASIKADAVSDGDGGKVIIWSDDTTRFYGTISARGGSRGGNGGFVEVSGKEMLLFRGRVDTRAPQGNTGTLLLDPANIVISDGSGDSVNDADALSASFAGSGSGTGVVVSGDNPVAGTLTLFQSEVEGIASTTNISLQATSAITINDLSNNNLNLAQAGGNSVAFNSAVFHMDASDTITTAGGALSITTTGTTTVGGLNTAGGAITLNLGGASTVSGVIAGTATTLTKSGAGTLTLSGANTYTGLTTVSAGVLNIRSNTALGTTAAGTTVASGAALELQGGITVGAETLSIAGTGVGGNGALRNISGTNTWGGTVTQTAASEIQSDAGTLILNAANSVTGAFALTVDGAANTAISGTITTGAGTLIKNGAGTLTLSGANTYTGATTVSAGTVVAASNAALGSAAGATTVASGAELQISGNGLTIAEPITSLIGTGVSGSGALRNLANNNTWTGAITLGAGGARINSDAGTLTASGAGNITGAFPLTLGGSGDIAISKVIATAAGTLTKDGAGTLTLSGTNTYTGATTVSAGVLSVQNIQGTGTTAGGVTVASGAALELQGGIVVGAEALNLSGTGIGGNGALRNISGTNTWGGAVTLGAGGAEIQSDAGTLTVASVTGATQNLTVDGAANTTITGVISTATGALTKNGAGTLTLSGVNTYTGATTINAGTLALDATGTIAQSSGVANNNATLTVAASKTIDSMTGAGATTISAGILTIGDASNTTATYDGVISGAGGLTKAGTGTLTLTGASDYTGATVVNAGVLNIRSNTALGTTAAGTTVASGAALELQGGITVGAETLSIAGTGVGGNGALRNISGTNTWGGTVTQTAASEIQSDAGTLILNAANSVTGAFALTVDGAANTAISGTITTGAGTLIKNGAGTLTLSGANTYTGATTVSGGALTFSGLNGAAASSSGFTVNQGSTLTLDNSGTNNTDRIAGTLAMNGGEFVVTGNSGAQTTELIGALTLNSGHSIITLTPHAAQNLQITFPSLTRTAGATGLFRGTNLGANTIASNTAGASNIVFSTTNPTLTGAGGAIGSTTMSIVKGAIGAGGAGGSTSLGADFLFYDDATNGLRPLTAAEYQTPVLDATALTAGANVKLTVNRNADDTQSINSLLLSGGVTYNHDNALGTNTLTLGAAARSGNVLSIGAANTIQSTQAGGVLAFGTAAGNEANIFTVADLTLGSNVAIVAATSTGGMTKSGPGVLLENRATTFTGGLFVNEGTLRSGTNAAFASQVLNVRAAGTFNLDTFTNTFTTLNLQSGSTRGSSVTADTVTPGTLTLTTTPAAIVHTLNGDGAAGATISGNLVLPAISTITVANGAATDDLAVSAIISGAATSLGKAGAGTLVLSNANTYAGATNVTAGTLNIRNALGTGTIAGGVVISNNAALELQGGITVGAEALSIVGTGVGANGALRNISGTNTWGGTVTQTAASEIQSDAGTLTLNAANSVTGAFNLTVDGAASTAISGTITTGAGTLTKNGTGTLTLSGTNTYTGATTVSAGVLNVQNIQGTGTTAGGVTVASGAALELQGGIAVGAETLSIAGTGVGGNGALRNISGANTWGGAVTQTAASEIQSDAGTLTLSSTAGGAFALTVDGAADTAMSGVVGGAGALSLVKNGTGTLTLSGANNYTGATTVNAGVLNLQNATATGTVAGGVTIASGAVLELQGGIVVGAEALTLSGTGIGGNGALRNISGANTWGGAITLASDTRINSDLNTLILSGGVNNRGNLLTVGGAGNTTFTTTAITGAGGLTKDGAGTTTLSFANTSSGATTISGGTLTLGVANAAATSSGIANSGNLTLGANNIIDSMTGSGTTTLGTFALTIGDASNTSSTYDGVISGTGGITKAGTGTLTLTGDNSYSGLTTISTGTLQLGAAGGATNTPLGTVAAGTIVSNGATLDLNGFTLGTSEALTLNGTGISGGGALTNSSGTGAAYSGLITLGSASSIVAGNGNIVISNTGTITGAGFGLTLGGTNAASSIASIIGTTTGTLIKEGSGTWTLSGTNTYTGATAVDAGTLKLSGGTAIADTGVVRLASGTTLDLTGSSETIGLLSNNTAGGIVTSSAAGAVTLTTGVEANSTFAGVIQDGSGTVALSKTGTGTLTLSGANTYGGVTNINAGTLIAANDNALGSTAGGTSVSSGATLNINSVAIGGEAIFISGNGAGGVGALTGTGTASLGVAGTLTLTGASRIGTTSGASTLTLGGAVSAGGNTLDITGAGNLTATNALNNFGAVTINSSGSVSLIDGNALTISALNVGTLTAQTLSGDLILGGNITATGTGDTIVLAAAANFDNSGGYSLVPNTGGGGRWLIYSTNPASDNRGGLGYNFKQYNATYGVTLVAGSGNGFLYTLAPTITPTLQGAITKTYDGYTAATLAAGNYKSTGIGEIDGDTVVLNNPATGVYASAHAGSGILVTADSASTFASASNGAAAVYGYQVSGTPASGSVGTITPVALSGSATIAPVAKAYDGFTVATGSTISGTTGGTVNGDTVALNTLGYTLDHSSAHAGATTITASGNAALGAITSAAVGTGDGSAGNRAAAIAGDYTLTLPATVTNQGVASSITPVALSGSATIAPVAKAYDGFTVATGSTISGTTGGTVNGDTVALNTLGYTLDHSSAHAGATTITASGNAALGAITSAAVGTGDGSAGNRAAAIAGDYTLTLPATVTNQGVASSITPVALSGSATIAPVAKAYDGFTVATGSTISGTTGGTVNGDTVALNTLGYTLDHSSAHAGATTITASGNAALGAITSAAVGTGDGSAGNRAAAIAGDYTLTLPATVTNQGVASSITPVALSGSATIAPVAKAYDGFTVATGSTISGTTGGTVNGDTVALNTLGYTLDHSSAHAGATTITASGNAALGAITSAAVGTGDGSAGNRAAAIAGDYTLTLPATVTNQGVASSITPVALSGSATIAPVAKAYDGFTVATGSTISGTTGGTVNGDTVALNTLGYTLDHSSAHAGATTITASGNAALGAITSAAVGTGDGSAGNRAAAIAGDYTLTLPATVTNQGVASSITPVALSGSATIAPVAKAYDGFTVATGSTISGTTGGTVNGDTVALNTLGYTLDHSSAHAGATTITASGNAALGAITSAAVGTGDGSAGNRAAAIAGDYTLTLPATVTNQGVASSITPVALSGSATIAPVAKAYDGFTVATGSTISGTTGGTVNGDTVALNTLGYTLDHSSAHAGATTITASGNAALGAITSAAVGTGDGSAGNRAAAIAGDYTLTLPATVTNQGVASSITPVALSGSATIAPVAKAYDGFTVATGSTISGTTGGTVNGDTVALNTLGYTLDHSSAHAGATTITASGNAALGAITSAAVGTGDGSAGNRAAAIAGDYTLTLPATVTNQGVASSITPVALSGSATIAPVAKAYDGFTVATGSTISGTTGGTVNGDTVALNTLGYTLDHSSAHAGATTITASGNAALGAITSAAVGTGDGSAGNRAAAIAGDYTLTLPATVTNQGVASSITPVALSGSATIAPVAKAYDGFTVATGSTISGTTGGTVNGDTVALNTLGYTLDHSSAHAGATTITASGNAALGAITSAAVGTGDGSAGNRAAAIAGDYTLTLPATVTNQGVASSITPVALSGSATIAPVAKAYDGFTVATGSTISGTTGGTVNGDTVALNTLGYTLDHSSAHAGATTITASGNAALGAITSAAVGTGDGSAGNRAAAIAGDYTLTLPATVTNQGVASSITPVALSGSATIAPVAKAYDGFTVATGSTISGTTGGTVNGDTVALNTLGYTLDHSSAHAGATTITASGNAALGAITSAAVGTGDGSAGNRAAAIAGDYTLTLPATVTNQGVASSITPVALSGSATIAPVAKAYDGFTVATGSTISGTTGGTVNGDTVALNTLGYTLDHSSAHAGATTITASGNAALGAITSAAVGTGDGSAGNRAAAIAGDYTLTLPATVTNQGVASSITPVALSGSATIAPVAKAYDGFTVATGSTISGTTGGTVNGDTVALNTLGYTLDHSSAHAGATTITASGNAALGAITSAAVGTGDGSAGNRAAAIAGDYTLTLPATVTNQGVASSITPVALSGSATIAPVAKAYDGFTVATGSTISGTTGGTVNGDTVALNTLGYTLDHSSAHAGATTITASGNAALGAITSAAVGTGDGSAGNRAAAIAGDYTLTLPATVTNQGVASSITPVALSGSATIAPVAKAYDGFTVATGSTISGTTGGTVNGDTVALNTLGYTLDHSSAHAGATTITASGNAALGAITSAAVGTGDGSAGNRAAAIAGDYTLTLPATVTNQGVASSITPVALSGSATIAPVAKAYDGFTVATGSTISGTTGGTVNGDTVALNTLGYTLDHSSAHAGATTITASGNAALGAITSAAVGTGDGSAGNRAAAIAGDYTLTLPATVTNQGVASSITPVALSGSATIAPVAKAYDGFTVATGSTISGTTGGTVNGDTVALNTLGYTLDHSSAHAGATTITASGNAALGAITSAAVGTGDGSAGNRAAAIAGDYTLTLPATVTNQGVASSITPVALSGSATIAPVAKAYDGFTVATGSTISGTTGGTVNGDTVALNTLGYTLDHSSAHAGATTITASGNAALGAITSAAVGTGDGSAGNRAAAIAGDYTLTLPATVTNQGVASSITPVALSGSATIAPVAKAYDGFTVATGSTISGTTGGTVNGDTVALNTLGYTLDHSSAHAGATTITASGNAALGAITSAAVGTGDGSAGNRAAAIAGDYTLTLPATVTNQGVASSITPVALSGSATIAPVAKAYDGFTVATGSTISGTTGGTVNGDTVALNTLGYTLDHSSAHAGATTITASGNAALGAITSAAVGTGDGSAGNRAAAIAGDYTLTLPATVTNQGVASSITPVALSGSATIAPVAKAYDGFTVATGSTISGTTGGTVNGDTVALNTLGYTLDHSSAHAGATTITASGNAALGAITSAAVGTGDGSAGNRAAAIAGDYTLTLPATVTNQGVASSITPVALSGSATIAPVAKAYDGFTVATGSTISGTTGGTVNGDTVALNTLGYTLDHSSAHAGATTITASGNAALGAITSAAVGTGDGSAGNRAAAIAGDYTLTLPATVTNQGVASSITPVALSGSATIAPVAKAYDGFTVATGSTISGTTGGTVNGDTVALNTLGYTLDHSSAHAGATTITASGNAALGAITSAAVGTGDGSAGNRAAAIAGDYTLTLPATVTNQGVASSITPKTVDLAGTRAYDSTVNFAASAFTPTITGTVGGETLTIASGTGTVPVNGVAAGTQTLNTGTLALGNGTGLASDYTFSGGSHTGAITPWALSITADDKSRLQGTPNPPFTATYGSFQGGDTPASLTGTLSFSTPAVIGSPAGPYPITPLGQSSTNYTITYVNGTLVVSGGIIVPTQPPASKPDAINLVVNGFYQLGDGLAQRSLADCSSVSVWAPWACGNQNTEPVVLVAAPAVTGALPQPAPEAAEFLALRPTPELMTTPAPTATSPAPQLAPDVAAVPALRPTPELVTTPGSRTPKYNDVMTAVMHRDRAAVVELLDFGWWVDRPDSNGLTPLMAAALNGDATITELLLQRGADPNRRAPGGSVLDYAARGGNSLVIELLRRVGAK